MLIYRHTARHGHHVIGSNDNHQRGPVVHYNNIIWKDININTVRRSAYENFDSTKLYINQ